ncbi:MAG TPA: allantoicase [Polyangiaceae bacterium]|nr:allantoicase [Polyangiaceae bacterium]
MTDFTDRFDLASLRLGAMVLAASDDFFAEKENLLLPHAAVWKEHEYTDRGKWMDGWESRRKRSDQFENGCAGGDLHDWAIVRLGVPGVVRGFVVDTAFFRGNFPESCAIEGCAAPIDARLETLLDPATHWFELLPRSPLDGNSQNKFAVDVPWAATHVRLRIFPDGGVARLRVYGDVAPDWGRLGHARGELDLAAVEHGGDVLVCSDMFFGERRNLVMPWRAKNMSDGWESRRRRGPGHDWAIVRLGATGTITRVEIDTNHFNGNFPDTARLEACHAPDADVSYLTGPDVHWQELLPRTKLQAHTRHYFEPELADVGLASHVRVSVFPDGGVSRLRIYGELDRAERLRLGVDRLDRMPPPDARAALEACCASKTWIEAMLATRPFYDVDAVYAASDAAWAKTGPDDWLEAFRAHPRIGEKKAESRQSVVAKRWSAGEQKGMHVATDAQKLAMVEANRAYEDRFGFRYIVCATGKSADDMVAFAKSRLANAPDDELRVAAGQQHEITRLRLEKLLEP